MILRENDIKIDTDIKIDAIESVMLNGGLELIDMPLLHLFTPGMYVRQIYMKAGILCTSKIHKTTHPFVVLKGKISVFSRKFGEQYIEAPYNGVTVPDTRRVLYIHEDCVWNTYHALDFITGEENGWSEERKAELLDKIESILIEPHINVFTGTSINDEYKKILNNIKNLETCHSQQYQ